ncbi:tetratricopeptide repeat protein [bacterium]|nr:tetratricopeptide repeat protein [bacterium]
MNKKIDEAVDLYNKHEYQKAIDIFSQVLETVEDSAEIYNNIATCYLQLGDYDKAEKHYLKAQSLNPKLPQVYINLADIYYKRGDMESGIQLMSQGIYELPEDMALRHYLARFYMEDARLDMAIDELYKILDEQPDNYDAYYDLARVNFELGNYDVAIENYENVLRYKENEWLHYYLAEAYEANNEVDKAISNYLKAIAIKSDFIPAYKKVAILFLARGDKDDAVEYFEDYISMDIPQDEKDQISLLIERIKGANVQK